MSKIAIVTDSTACIPDDLVQEYQIRVAPQVLIWGEETYEDGIDIQPTEFYNRLSNASQMPSTSQATIASFKEIYTDLYEDGYDIISILISSKLSGTVDSALQAKEFVPDARVEIIDSYTTAMAMGYQVLAAARARDKGMSYEECVSLAKSAGSHVGVVFAVDTLEFLHRGGRIGGASRFLGTALNIKPILEVVGGKVEAIERVRTRKKSLLRVLELIENRIGGREPVRLATLHAKAPEEAKELLEMAKQRFRASEVIFTEVTPVIGTHAGPGTVELAFMAGL